MERAEDECRMVGDRPGKQDNEENIARLDEYRKSAEAKAALRNNNLNPKRPGSGFLRTLDSSIKRNTAVIKELKQINDDQREGLMDELKSVNLSKFVREAVAAICDAKLRTSDIQAAVQVCSLLHQRYEDFSPSLIQGLLKVLFLEKLSDDLETDNSLRAMKKRSSLKLLVELYFVGITEDVNIFVNIIKDLTASEDLKDRDATLMNLSLLTSFSHQGRFLLGLQQPGPEVQDEFFKSLNVTADQMKFFKKALHSYYDAAVELLQSEHTSLKQMEMDNAKALSSKGELSDENATVYEKLRKSFDNLFRGVSSLAEALDLKTPVMPNDGHTTRVTMGVDASSVTSGKETSLSESVWDDEDTRAFYESLPDLRAIVPAVLLGESEPKLTEQQVKSDYQHACLDDFTHHNIDVACDLLVTCGRFLYHSPETTICMSNMLEILVQLKSVKNLDPRHSTLVENAYYVCKLPERSALAITVRPPLFQYIRKLLFSDLDNSTVERVLEQLLKLPWAECESYILKCFLKVHKGNYNQVDLIAFLAKELSHYHDEFAVAVVDEVLEEIRVGLELNDYRMKQRRLAHMRLLGELYNFQLIDSEVMFATLDLIIMFGHDTPEQAVLDPPEDYFRIRMVTTLLLTCGHHFKRGSSKRKLDRFLIYFQQYALSKGPIPIDIEFDIQDIFAELRPHMTRCSSMEEVNSALLELEDREHTALIDKANNEKHLDSESQKAHPSSSAVPTKEIVQVRQKLAQVSPKEVEDFDRELRAIMQESLESRKLESQTRPTLNNMMSPMNVFEGSKDPMAVDGEEMADENGWQNKVRVKVLMKRGTKQQTKQILIPQDCSLVQSTKQNKIAELEEKQDIKRKILEYCEREEEESSGDSSQEDHWTSYRKLG